jgi:hypothetical protein
MKPKLRDSLVYLGAIGFSVWIGVQVAQGEYVIAALLSGLSLWTLLSWVRGAHAEAWLLGFLIFGYVIGNRGFAQVTLFPGLPLLFGELGLGFALTVLLLRGALQRQLPWSGNGLGYVLLFWLALGFGRIPWDVRTYGFLALRDFATLYYALFFFVTLVLCRHEKSRLVLRLALTATFVVLPVTTLLAGLFPDFFLTNLLIKGVPLILYKEDLATTYGYVGFLWLLPRQDMDRSESWWRWGFAAALLVNGLLGLSRASLVGLLVASVWLARSGRWRALRTIAVVCLAGLVAVTSYSVLQRRQFNQTKAYAVYEAAASIVDFSGTRTYQSGYSNDKGDNNRFRLVWWRNVAEATLQTSPLLGLGFGADLASGFVQEYYPDTANEFTTRSPHNVFMTMLGRLGLLGVAAWLLVYVTQAVMTARVAHASRQNNALEEAMILHAMCWVVMISACFGVVLEGPMGAIPFWIILGLAHHESSLSARPDPAPEPPAPV